MKNTIGPPVSGDDFAGRRKNLNKAIRLLNNHNSFLILGIRRTGKSSFLQQVAYLLKQEDKKNICIELDCQTFETTLDFYKGLYSAMPKSLQIRFKKLLNDSKQIPTKMVDYLTDNLKSISLLGNKIELHDKLMTYHKPFESIVNRFFKSEQEKVFLFLDELPFFFENIEESSKKVDEIVHILTGLRSWRNTGLAMGITGSLNLSVQLEQLGISKKLLAGLNTIKLESFSREESFDFIERLSLSDSYSQWSADITNKLLDLLPDYIPYFLQYSYNEIAVNECKTPQEIEYVFHNDIMSGLFRDFLYQFQERLRIFKGDDLNIAMKILDNIALDENLNLDDLQNKLKSKFDYEILVKLMDNEFISEDQYYHFGLNIIKNWWINKRGLNHKK